MTGTERGHEDDARPIPQRPTRRMPAVPGSGPGRSADPDAVYTVDTRRKVSFSRPSAAPPRSPSGRGTAYPPGPGGAGPRGPRPPGRPAATTAGAPPRRPSSARFRRRRLAALLVLLVLGWLAFMVIVPFAAWQRVERVDTAPAKRPADTAGHTYLLVGSDSREGLTQAQEQELSTGPDEGGKRTDSIMLVHVPSSGGKPVIVSIPRDSYVPIPRNGTHKINAAFALGGGKLLTETIETATGLHVDGYLEIGFAGFAGIVDSLGGVDICVARDMNDPLAGINLKAGCQTLDGKNALGYVRSRHNDPLGDLGRAERQRQFLGAVMKKAVTPSTVLVPWRYKAFADAASAGLTVGSDTSLSDAVAILQALRSVGGGDGLSLQVPIETAALQTPSDGVAVKWDATKAKALFTALKNDEPLTAPPAGTQPK